MLRDTNDVTSSQGVFHRIFVDTDPGQAVDGTIPAPDPDGFRVGSLNVRRVEPRNTPTMINAVFNFSGQGTDILIEIPAVGRDGGPPLPRFPGQP